MVTECSKFLDFGRALVYIFSFSFDAYEGIETNKSLLENLIFCTTYSLIFLYKPGYLDFLYSLSLLSIPCAVLSTLVSQKITIIALQCTSANLIDGWLLGCPSTLTKTRELPACLFHKYKRPYKSSISTNAQLFSFSLQSQELS